MYLKSNLPEVSYFKAMTACAICDYIKTALKVCEDKVNKDNVDTAIIELENFVREEIMRIFRRCGSNRKCQIIKKSFIRNKK